MSVLVSNVITEINESIEIAKEKARKQLGLPQTATCGISKTSIDARKGKIRFVHTVSVETCDEEKLYSQFQSNPHITLRKEVPLEIQYGSEQLLNRPVIVGFGPAGMFCGLLLARCGYQPLIIERGASIEERVRLVEDFWKTGSLNTNTNVQFGEGGAGTFSDGKLTTRIGDPKCAWVLREFVKFGAPQEIEYKAKPHIGTDLLRNVVQALRNEILSLGGEVRFSTTLLNLHSKAGYVCVNTSQGEIPAEALVLATGHSARDVFTLLSQKGVPMQSKPFSVGVRVEHLQNEIDRGLYGAAAGHPALPPGEYQLSYREGERGVYTFCMCPGGVVVPAASENGMVVTNGMSYHARDGVNANAALAVSVTANDYGNDILAGMHFQQQLEQKAFAAGSGCYRAPIQDVQHFLAGKSGLTQGRVVPSYCRGVQESNFHDIFPNFVSKMLENGLINFSKKLPGFAASDTLLTGIETRTSSPIRIMRMEDYTSPGFSQIYPCAEGAGHAGGIMSAAVDGLRVALAIIARFSPPKGGT